MFVEFTHTLRKYTGQILGWGIGLALLGVLLISVYDSLADQMELYQEMVQSLPENMMAFFGGQDVMATPEGFVAMEFFSYMPLILGIFAVQAGSGLLARDEEEGTLDLIMAHPISRTGLFLGRLLAFLLALAAVLVLAWLGIVVPMNWSTMSLSLVEVARPFVSLYAVLVFFGALGLLLSLVLPSRRWASLTTGLVLVAGFFIDGLAELNENLESLARLTPLNYYQHLEAFDGLKAEWLLGLFAVSLIFSGLAWWRYLRRDIRVAGEGGWKLAGLNPFSSSS
jgi:ABC-2 type transport system permease protein